MSRYPQPEYALGEFALNELAFDSGPASLDFEWLWVADSAVSFVGGSRQTTVLQGSSESSTLFNGITVYLLESTFPGTSEVVFVGSSLNHSEISSDGFSLFEGYIGETKTSELLSDGYSDAEFYPPEDDESFYSLGVSTVAFSGGGRTSSIYTSAAHASVFFQGRGVANSKYQFEGSANTDYRIRAVANSGLWANSESSSEWVGTFKVNTEFTSDGFAATNLRIQARQSGRVLSEGSSSGTFQFIKLINGSFSSESIGQAAIYGYSKGAVYAVLASEGNSITSFTGHAPVIRWSNLTSNGISQSSFAPVNVVSVSFISYGDSLVNIYAGSPVASFIDPARERTIRPFEDRSARWKV